MQKENSSLIVTVVGLALQGIAWILPNAPQEIRLALSVLSILLVIFAQGGGYEGMRTWLSSITAFLILNYPLVLAVILSGGVLIALSSMATSSLTVATQFIVTGLLAASLSALIMSQARQKSVRIIKGSSDKVYLVENGVKRHIPEPVTLKFVLLDTYAQVERISDWELRLYRERKPLPVLASCELVKGSGAPIYLIWEGRRKHIPDVPTYQHFFGDRQSRQINDEELEAIPRTGALRSILSTIPAITVHGEVGSITINP